MNLHSYPTRSTRRHTPRTSNCSSSAASSKSSRSGDGGGKIRRMAKSGASGGDPYKAKALSRSFSLDLRRPAQQSQVEGGVGTKSLQRLGRGSLPKINDLRPVSSRTRSKVSSKKNEEWDCLDDCGNLSEQKARLRDLLGSGPKHEPGVDDSSTKARRKTNRHVAFAEADPLVGHEASYDDLSSKWYSPKEVEQFSREADACAVKVDRTMRYISKFEASFRPSTGLPSPQALKEYLSSPAEVIGIEHLLPSQKSIRKTLQVHHTKGLLEEQRVLGRLDFRRRNSSAISANSAQERAEYINLLE